VELKEGLEEIKLNMQYPKDFINQIITGDCLEVMKGIPDNSIDLVLTDPPYNIAADITVIIDTRIHGNKNRKILSNLANSEWDKMNKMEYIEKMKNYNKYLKEEFINGYITAYTRTYHYLPVGNKTLFNNTL